MRQLTKSLVCLIISCIFFYTSSAQNLNENRNSFRAVHWGLDEGLSQAETSHMIKDANGFLWIGTKRGLNRFDGNTFKVYLHQDNNNQSIIDDNVTGGLVEDSLHNIWIGAEKGLSRYNVKTEDFTNFAPDTTIANNIAEISPFWATKNEVLCIEHESAITSYNIFSSTKKILAKFPRFREGFIGIAAPYSIFDSSNNTVWGLITNNDDEPSLLEVFLSTGENKVFTLPRYSTHRDAEAMCFDAQRKCIWINSNEGLLQFTLADRQYHHIRALSKYEHLKNYFRFVGITLDKLDRVWFATDPKGIIIYNPADESVSFPFPADSTMQNNVSFANACLYSDRDNIIWSGSWLRKGIYAILPFSPVVKHYVAVPGNKNSLSNNDAAGVQDAGNNNLWIGTGGGINILDTKTGMFSVLQPKDLHGLKSNGSGLNPIKIDTLSQKAWLRTNVYFIMNMVTRRCTRIVFKKFDGETIPAGGIPRNDGKAIFFTTDNGKSQDIYVLNTDSIVAHQVLQTNNINIFFTTPAQNHFLFLCGNNDKKDNQTFVKIENKWVRTHTLIDSIAWTDIFFNRKDFTYWVAGENQLFHFDKNFHIIRMYSKKDGLPQLPIVGLIDDNNGNIWFHTDRSILELNIVTGQFITMSETDGFQKQDFDMLPFVDKDARGDIYYCSELFGVGFNKINPANFISNASSVYLISLTINDKAFPLKASINYTDTLTLAYNQAKIAIDAGIIDFYSRGKSRIRYKLEKKGSHEEWQYASYYYTIRYESLEPGNYQLVMQASNASNTFNGPVKTIFININPAFWNTWWFRIPAILFIITISYRIIRWRVKEKFRLRLERSEREKEISEIKRETAELEMKALRAQMNPHFIFNSLNSINRFILQNNRQQASEYLTKFSRLVRLILQNSQASLINLESELESLSLYLELESVRFDNRFVYKITVPQDLDIEILKIPPLIIQPYAENAIWHGLMHKEEKGQLDIEISQEDEHLYFKITDNGIGRKKAAELASKNATKHKSMGLKITSDRIAMLQKSNGAESPVKFIDLENPDGSVAGTEVIIKMPLIYD